MLETLIPGALCIFRRDGPILIKDIAQTLEFNLTSLMIFTCYLQLMITSGFHCLHCLSLVHQWFSAKASDSTFLNYCFLRISQKSEILGSLVCSLAPVTYSSSPLVNVFTATLLQCARTISEPPATSDGSLIDSYSESLSPQALPPTNCLR